MVLVMQSPWMASSGSGSTLASFATLRAVSGVRIRGAQCHDCGAHVRSGGEGTSLGGSECVWRAEGAHHLVHVRNGTFVRSFAFEKLLRRRIRRDLQCVARDELYCYI